MALIEHTVSFFGIPRKKRGYNNALAEKKLTPKKHEEDDERTASTGGRSERASEAPNRTARIAAARRRDESTFPCVLCICIYIYLSPSIYIYIAFSLSRLKSVCVYRRCYGVLYIIYRQRRIYTHALASSRTAHSGDACALITREYINNNNKCDADGEENVKFPSLSVSVCLSTSLPGRGGLA